jgi:hypothetical protein
MILWLRPAKTPYIHHGLVSKKEIKGLHVRPGSLRVSSILSVFDSVAFVLGECKHACVASEAEPGTGGVECHGASICS